MVEMVKRAKWLTGTYICEKMFLSSGFPGNCHEKEVTALPKDMGNRDEWKRKLRSLKKLELKIRYGGAFHASNINVFPKQGKSSSEPGNIRLVWDEFFQEGGSGRGAIARYSLEDLLRMSKEEYRSVVEEYFFYVYYRFYTENGIAGSHLYDPEILAWMGLAPDSGLEEIRKKFRELAKKYHPDTGGDNGKFIELMEQYHKLVE